MAHVSRPRVLDQGHRNTGSAITTRRASLLETDRPPPRQLALAPEKPALPSRSLSARKRPAPDAPPDTRPPKLAVTPSHSHAERITNGTKGSPAPAAVLDVSATRATPRPGSAGKINAPAPGSSTTDKRSLRSHDGGSRLKSDLTTYFANYDDIIAGLPKQAEFLDLDTPIYLIDEPLKAQPPEATRKSLSPTRSRKPRLTTPPARRSSVSMSGIPAAQSSTSFQVLNYSSIAPHIHYASAEDPLADAHFFTQHRRAERKEKQLRNIEKERAQHEKVQLERLLDGLQGPDWLKVMGITGVTDGERKDWEPRRAYFVAEVEALVDKFRVWKEAEKRLRVEKEAALAARDEDSEEEHDDDALTPDSPEDEHSVAIKSRLLSSHTQHQQQHHRPPEPPKPRRPPRPHGFLLPFIPPAATAPFTSFYAKPHLRAAALGKHRHGRNASAFGAPLPEWEEQEFELPDEYIEPGFLRDNARQRRRRGVWGIGGWGGGGVNGCEVGGLGWDRKRMKGGWKSGAGDGHGYTLLYTLFARHHGVFAVFFFHERVCTFKT